MSRGAVVNPANILKRLVEDATRLEAHTAKHGTPEQQRAASKLRIAIVTVIVPRFKPQETGE
jgi:hypothetical protein